MPTPCQKCGEWFDLNDGRGSKKWYPNTVICSDCAKEEQEEIERDKESGKLEADIAELENDIQIAKREIKEQEHLIEECNNNMQWAKERLAELKKLQ